MGQHQANKSLMYHVCWDGCTGNTYFGPTLGQCKLCLLGCHVTRRAVYHQGGYLSVYGYNLLDIIMIMYMYMMYGTWKCLCEKLQTSRHIADMV